MSLFDPGSLQEVIHGRARLAVLAFLTTVGSADFGSVRQEVGISDGNLSQHLRKLEDAGYIRLEKTFVASALVGSGRQRTLVNLTPEGRKAFYDYLDHLQVAP
ncbi:MAG: transcriptional regulator [Asticcacaulis sp.]